MALFHHILFPVDFSKRCHVMAPSVRAAVARNQAQLTVFHAFDLPVGGYGDSYALTTSTVNEIRDASLSAMDKFARQRFGDMWAPALQTTVNQGSPVESIVEYINENGIDLVMMPSHGRGRFRTFLLGSVTAAVLHDTHCPVWTDAHCDQAPPPQDVKNVVCAIDLKPKSAEELRFAKRVACENRASLTVVYSEPGIEDFVQFQSAVRFRDFLEFRAKEEYQPLAEAAGLEVPIEVVSGPLGESIAGAVKRHRGDLLMIGRGVIEERLGRLRTDAYDIIRSSPCPVLSV